MNPTPNMTLQACPVCSSDRGIERPGWQFARHSSRAQNRNCYFWTGCKHATAVIEPTKMRSDPEDWQACEDAWTARADQLFQQITERWNVGQRDRFWRTLTGRFTMPGVTDQLPLEADSTPPAPAAAAPRARVVRDPSSGEVLEQ